MLIGLELPTIVFTVFISRYITTADSRPGWKGPLILGWAGMRGVVSLAAALSIPFALPNGHPFPQRNLILFITFVVIILTLLVQGLTLPVLIRKLNMKDPDHYGSAEEQDLQVRKRLTDFSLAFLDKHYPGKTENNQLLRQLRGRFFTDHDFLEHISQEVYDEYCTIYQALLKQQRAYLETLNKELETDESIIRKYQGLLDLEQEKLLSLYEIG